MNATDPRAGVNPATASGAARRGFFAALGHVLWNLPIVRSVGSSPWRLLVWGIWTLVLGPWVLAMAASHASGGQDVSLGARLSGIVLGFGLGFLVASVDLQCDRVHRWLFAVQLPLLAVIPMVAIGLVVGLHAIIDVAVGVAEAPVFVASRGADNYARLRAIATLSEQSIGQRQVAADMLTVGRALGFEKESIDGYRAAAAIAFGDGRLSASRRISTQVGDRSGAAIVIGDEIAGRDAADYAVGALGRALAAQRRGDDREARRLIDQSRTLLPGDPINFSLSQAPQWANRQVLYARDLSEAYPDLEDTIAVAVARVGGAS